MATTALAAPSDSLSLYLDGIGRTPLLTAEEERELARRIEAGRDAGARLERTRIPEERAELRRLVADASAARDAFVEANLRLVVSIAGRYRLSTEPLELLDLVQEGNVGLLRAVEKFDWRKGFKFSTYATWWIRQAIQRALLEKGRALRVPARIYDAHITLSRERSAFEAEVGRSPTPTELADRAGMPVELVEEVQSIGGVTSLESPVGEDGAMLGEFVADDASPAPEDAALRSSQSSALRAAIGRLSEREQLIVRRRFGFDDGDPSTLAEIGRILDLTPERIHQLEKRALCRLRHPAFGLVEDDLW